MCFQPVNLEHGHADGVLEVSIPSLCDVKALCPAQVKRAGNKAIFIVGGEVIRCRTWLRAERLAEHPDSFVGKMPGRYALIDKRTRQRSTTHAVVDEVVDIER